MSSIPPGRIAGIDYGTVRIGVAVCDSRQTLASPLDNYQRRGIQADADYFRRLVAEERLTRFVVGLPVHVSGDESQKSREARDFGAWLNSVTGVPVEFFDERYTSVEAEQYLQGAGLTKKRRKARLDMLAAQILLSAYLEARGAAGAKTGGDTSPRSLEPLDDKNPRSSRGGR